jgi:hypothetical protein
MSIFSFFCNNISFTAFIDFGGDGFLRMSECLIDLLVGCGNIPVVAAARYFVRAQEIAGFVQRLLACCAH